MTYIFFNDTATTEIYTLSLHDALPIYTELGVMATVESTCEECEGRRFQAAVLDYTLGGRNIAEVLAMSVDEAERSEEHTSELQSRQYLVCRLLLEKKTKKDTINHRHDS